MTSREIAEQIVREQNTRKHPDVLALVSAIQDALDAHAAEAVAAERDATVLVLCPRHAADHRLPNGVWWGFCGARVLLESFEDRARSDAARGEGRG